MKRRAVLITVLFAFMLVPALLFAQQASHETHHPVEAQAPPESSGEQEASADPMMQKMMTMHEQMMKKMEDMQARLDQKITAMNAATGGQEQVEAIKAVVNEMVSQRNEMMSKMMGMHGKMCKMMDGMKGKMGKMMGDMPGEEEGAMAGGSGMKMMKKLKGKGGEKNIIVIIQE